MLINHRAVTCAALFVAFALMSNGAKAYQCKTNFVQAEALGNPKIKAQKAAKTIWATTVTNAYGLQWSSWDIAKSKSLGCSWTGTKFYCTARAKPCLYVVP